MGAWTSLSISYCRGLFLLAGHYNRDLSPCFPSQLLAFRACFKAEFAKGQSIQDLVKMHSSLAASFSDVCTAFSLYLTIPVTVATAERYFSKLKLIKTYLRSAMAQEQLLSIENERARKLDFTSIVNEVAEQKARRVNF